MTITAVVLDDEESIARLVKRLLTREGFEVYRFTKPKEALKYLAKNPADLLVTDFDMPGGLSGLKVFKIAKRIKPNLVAVCISGTPNNENVCIQNGFDVFVQKPFRNKVLIEEILRLIKNKMQVCSYCSRKKNEHNEWVFLDSMDAEIDEHVDFEICDKCK